MGQITSILSEEEEEEEEDFLKNQQINFQENFDKIL